MGLGNVLRVLPFMADTGGDLDLGVNGIVKLNVFGQEAWITTTHVSILIVVCVIVIFALIANRAIKKADADDVPRPFLTILEIAVEAVDNLTISNMGQKYGGRFSNYIGTLFMYLAFANLCGLLGLRPPTADYGCPLGLALITFVIIHYNGFKHEKAMHIGKLFQPVVLTPINIIGEIATPMSMSLRLFGNIMSGTIMMGLIYGLLPKLLQCFMWPAFGFLHAYFDIFSGLIQTYVFCMLTMVFTAQCFGEEDA